MTSQDLPDTLSAIHHVDLTPTQVPHLGALLYSFRQHQCAPPGCGAPVPDIKAAFRQRLAAHEQEQATATAAKLTATALAGTSPPLLGADTPMLAPVSNSLFREEAATSLKSKGHTRPRLGSWDINLVKQIAQMAAPRSAGVQRPQAAGEKRMQGYAAVTLRSVSLLDGNPTVRMRTLPGNFKSQTHQSEMMILMSR